MIVTCKNCGGMVATDGEGIAASPSSLCNCQSRDQWFDERKEANIIASKRSYDEIYDAAVSAFKRLRELHTISKYD